MQLVKKIRKDYSRFLEKKVLGRFICLVRSGKPPYLENQTFHFHILSTKYLLRHLKYIFLQAMVTAIPSMSFRTIDNLFIILVFLDCCFILFCHVLWSFRRRTTPVENSMDENSRNSLQRSQTFNARRKSPSNSYDRQSIAVSSDGKGKSEINHAGPVGGKASDVHRAPSTNERSTKPRSLTFTLFMSTTSTKSPEVIAKEIERVLLECGYLYSKSAKYLYSCTDARNVEWSIEICYLPRRNCNGIKIDRIKGTWVDFLNIRALLVGKFRV